MRTEGAEDSRDLLSDRFATIAMYWLPIAVVVASGFFSISNGWRGAIWAAALITMGAGCILNAFRCGRVHCYATGPFFFIMAVIAVLCGLGITPVDARGWNAIALITLAGGIALYYLPERFFGRYRRR
jgi:hypothetical protein